MTSSVTAGLVPCMVRANSHNGLHASLKQVSAGLQRRHSLDSLGSGFQSRQIGTVHRNSLFIDSKGRPQGQVPHSALVVDGKFWGAHPDRSKALPVTKDLMVQAASDSPYVRHLVKFSQVRGLVGPMKVQENRVAPFEGERVIDHGDLGPEGVAAAKLAVETWLKDNRKYDTFSDSMCQTLVRHVLMTLVDEGYLRVGNKPAYGQLCKLPLYTPEQDGRPAIGVSGEKFFQLVASAELSSTYKAQPHEKALAGALSPEEAQQEASSVRRDSVENLYEVAERSRNGPQ